MSIYLMTLAFKTALPPMQKFLLVALADSANDQGECYPSVVTLATKCSMGERTVQDALRALEDAGQVRREFRKGRSTIYWITPAAAAPQGCRSRTPADCAPPQIAHPTPAVPAPPPPQQPHPTPAAAAPITVKEPSIEPKGNRQKRAVQGEVGVDALVEAGFDAATAAEFIATKRQRKAPLTPRAWADHQREALKAGWSVQQAAEKVMAKTWKGFEASYVQQERPPSRAAPASFRESDRRADEAKVAFLTGRKPQVFEATDVTPRRLDREDFFEVVGDVRPGLPAPVRRS